MRDWWGNDFIVEEVQNYRDTIQFVHDKSDCHINYGRKMDKLTELAKLTADLDGYLDDDLSGDLNDALNDNLDNDLNDVLRLRECNDRLSLSAHSLDNECDFMGDSMESSKEFSRLLLKDSEEVRVKMLGGRDPILKEARVAINTEEYGWAVALLTPLIRVDQADQEARNLRAFALKEWRSLQKNSYWKNLSVSAEKDQRGVLVSEDVGNFATQEIVHHSPVGTMLEEIRINLNPEKISSPTKINFVFTDLNERYNYVIRNENAAFSEGIIPNAPTVSLTKKNFLAVLFKKSTLEESLSSGAIKVDGNKDDFINFLRSFDTIDAAKSELSH